MSSARYVKEFHYGTHIIEVAFWENGSALLGGKGEKPHLLVCNINRKPFLKEPVSNEAILSGRIDEVLEAAKAQLALWEKMESVELFLIDKGFEQVN